MKKLFSIILAAALVAPMFAETDANADYSDWLPKAGDWNIQVGMSPTAIVMGGTWSNIGGFSAGYMITDKMSVRASLGLNVDVWNTRKYAQDDAAVAKNAFSKQKVVDSRKHESLGGTISVGADWHVGSKHKVQGVFGVGLMYGFKAIDKYTYYYNNAITELNQIPSTNLTLPDGTTAVWANFPSEATGIANGRVLRQYDGTSGPRQMVGLYLSAGLEWFVTPKLALGLNANVNCIYQFMHAYTTEYEGWSQYEHKVVKWTEAEQPMENGFSFKTSDVAGFTMYMSIYL
ncbi:MAG: hypothetical protein IJ834_05835 [Paludibacteraceae bacterium]|nr:hypothetical protein [Paludibacteraceae bacterium]